ncbi:MAG TPA: hypothetical protein VHE35_06020 [Kofleriaceae bacterium]|nr:hypothetical protein [Kofleriaceae bacterium]
MRAAVRQARRARRRRASRAFETGVDVTWRFDHEGAAAPGVYEGGRSQTVDSLPPVLAERLHEQFPATDDIE